MLFCFVFTKTWVLNRQQYQKTSNDTQPYPYVTSALTSALSLSKCHLVSLIFSSFTKKALRWKRYVTSKTLRLTMCFFFFLLLLFCLIQYFFKSLFFYFGSSHVACSIMKLFCAHGEGCKVIWYVGKCFI